MGYSIAYNSGTTTPFGTFKQGTITMGLKPDEYTVSSGFTWYANAEYLNDSYLIISDTYSQGWSTQSEAKPTIWRSETGTTESFVSLVNQLPDVNGVTGFTDSGSAMGYLQSTGKYFVSKDEYLGIVTDGLVLNLDAGWYPSYSGTGTTWKDLSGSNNGTLINGPTFNSDNGGSIVFDGVDDYVESVSNTNITGTSPRTLSVWGYQTTQSLNFFYSICRIGIGTERQLFEILLYNNSVFGHFWGGGQALAVNSDKNLLNTYTNISLSYDGVTVYIYVDGVLKGQSNFSLITGNSKLILGRKTFGGHYDYVGKIFVSQLYNRALSASEVLQNYNATKGRFGL